MAGLLHPWQIVFLCPFSVDVVEAFAVKEALKFA